VPIDFQHLLRIPETNQSEEPLVPQDEFECLNLDVSLPKERAPKMPVLIWIHGEVNTQAKFPLFTHIVPGGSQVMTFMPAASPCASTTSFVAHSALRGQPTIVVYVNYRLNIFSFGDGSGSHNLALSDQRLAIDWVVKHIASFGGDSVSL
jgi:carboxylesterase type B